MASGKAPVTMVALLRGINVGKAKRVAMADLRQAVEGLGYGNVRTLLNSGNVVFTGTPAEAAKVAARIERAVEEKTSVSSRVTVISAEEAAYAVEKNPLSGIAADHSRLMIAVAADAAILKPIHAIDTASLHPEVMAVGDRFVWVWSPAGVLESKALAAINRTLRDAVTVRNLATMIKLDAMCRAPLPS